MTAAEPPGLVLVVDDTEANRYVTGTWLRRHGHQVIEATTGAEALAALNHWPVELVVLDVGLPDMSGFEVCERIKGDPALACPVVHLSATSVRGADRAHGLTRGADAYLTEPVEPDELAATVASVLRSHRARDAAERLADRLARLTGATLAIHGATTFDQLASAIAAGASDVFGATTTVLMPTPGGEVRRAVVHDPRRPEAVLDRAPPTLLAQVLAHGPADATAGAFPVPAGVLAPGDPVGGLDWTAVLLRPRGSHPPLLVALRQPLLRAEQNDLLAQLGHAAALATDALRLFTEEHDLALTLQRSFLPQTLPARPGLEIAVRYEPAADNAEIGGDFYEFVELDDGRLLVAVGDVAGHSIHAATIMVELRHALRAYAIEGHGPARILERLERLLRHYHPAEFTTLCLLLLDPERNEITAANAGHLPPLLVADGVATYLPVRGSMLGLRHEPPPETVRALPPCWTLVMITDGLVEAPGVDLDSALEALRLAVSVEEAPERLCELLLDRFGGAHHDDIALLVLRRG